MFGLTVEPAAHPCSMHTPRVVDARLPPALVEAGTQQENVLNVPELLPPHT